ncbi:MAG: FlxA-like family protein [Candidatus Wallbacteria bacterium]
MSISAAGTKLNIASPPESNNSNEVSQLQRQITKLQNQITKLKDSKTDEKTKQQQIQQLQQQIIQLEMEIQRIQTEKANKSASNDKADDGESKKSDDNRIDIYV